jgi:hypothetical protein
MSYTVAWKPSAEQDLASLWTSASDRQAVTDAANRIDALLRVDPNTQGESGQGRRGFCSCRPWRCALKWMSKTVLWMSCRSGVSAAALDPCLREQMHTAPTPAQI